MGTEDLPASLEISGDLEKLVEHVEGEETTVYLTHKGRSVAVLLDVNHYNALLDAADAMDSSFEGEEEAGIMADILEQYRLKSRSSPA